MKNTQRQNRQIDISRIIRDRSYHMPEDENANSLVFDSPDLRYGFTQIPNCVLKDMKLSSNDVRLYALLLSYAWQTKRCWPGHSVLAANMGAGERSVVRSMANLKRRNLISIERRGQGKCNIYHIRKLSDAYPQMVDRAKALA